jgi:hypothetical protein
MKTEGYVRSKEIARKLAQVKGIEVRGHGTRWVQIASTTSFVIAGETTPLCQQVESLLPKGWEIEVNDNFGRHNSYKCVTTTKYGNGF